MCHVGALAGGEARIYPFFILYSTPHTLRLFYSFRTKPQAPIKENAGETPGAAWIVLKRKRICPLFGKSIHDPGCRPITVLITLWVYFEMVSVYEWERVTSLLVWGERQISRILLKDGTWKEEIWYLSVNKHSALTVRRRHSHLQKREERREFDLCASVRGSVGRSCEYGCNNLGRIKCGNFFASWGNVHFLRTISLRQVRHSKTVTTSVRESFF